MNKKRLLIGGLVIGAIGGGIAWYLLSPLPNKDLYAVILVDQSIVIDPLDKDHPGDFEILMQRLAQWVTQRRVLHRALHESEIASTETLREARTLSQEQWLREHLRVEIDPGGTLRISLPVRVPTREALLIINSVAEATIEEVKDVLDQREYRRVSEMRSHIQELDREYIARKQIYYELQSRNKSHLVAEQLASAYEQRLIERLADLKLQLADERSHLQSESAESPQSSETTAEDPDTKNQDVQDMGLANDPEQARSPNSTLQLERRIATLTRELDDVVDREVHKNHIEVELEILSERMERLKEQIRVCIFQLQELEQHAARDFPIRLVHAEIDSETDSAIASVIPVRSPQPRQAAASSG